MMCGYRSHRYAQGRGSTREGVACASGLNWCSFILLLFATCSTYWSWGYAFGASIQNVPTSVSVSTGPWIAGWAWSTYLYACNCNINGWCYSWCRIVSPPVYWNQLSAENACGPDSTIFKKFSQPLGLCSFPNGITPSPTTATQETPPPTVVEVNIFGGVPQGTTFNVPSQVPSLQALIIIATIAVFFAAVAGCADAGMDHSRKIAGACAAFWSLISWVFCLAAYCLWTTFPYVAGLQASNPTVWMPFWQNTTGNQITAIDTNTLWLGAGWATALTASIITFISNLVHCASLKGEDLDTFSPDPTFDTKSNVPAEPVQSVPAQAIPVQAVPVAPASVNAMATV